MDAAGVSHWSQKIKMEMGPVKAERARTGTEASWLCAREKKGNRWGGGVNDGHGNGGMEGECRFKRVKKESRTGGGTRGETHEVVWNLFWRTNRGETKVEKKKLHTKRLKVAG